MIGTTRSTPRCLPAHSEAEPSAENCRNRTAVRTRPLGVLLMVILGAIKGLKRADLRHDLVRLLLLRAHDGCAGRLVLGGGTG